jgi:hypothetical protein
VGFTFFGIDQQEWFGNYTSAMLTLTQVAEQSQTRTEVYSLRGRNMDNEAGFFSRKIDE